MPKRNWHGILSDDPPPARFMWLELYRQSSESLGTRARKFPNMIQYGEIEEPEAMAELAIWRAMKSDWLWIMTGEGEPIPQEMIAPALDQLGKSLANLSALAREIITKHGEHFAQKELGPMAERLVALAWHYDQQVSGGFDVHFCARFNHERKGALGQTVDQRRAFWGLPPRRDRKPQQEIAA